MRRSCLPARNQAPAGLFLPLRRRQAAADLLQTGVAATCRQVLHVLLGRLDVDRQSLSVSVEHFIALFDFAEFLDVLVDLQRGGFYCGPRSVTGRFL